MTLQVYQIKGKKVKRQKTLQVDQIKDKREKDK